jgi:hypothetical protein
MIKAIAVVLVLVLAYFFFIKPDFPNYIEFQSEQFGPSSFQSANDSQSQMYRYNSESRTNSDYILLLKPNSDTDADMSDFLGLFSDHFATQGFSFQKRGDQMLGLRKDAVIYMTIIPIENLVAMLVVETTDKPRSISEAKETFNSLSKISM